MNRAQPSQSIGMEIANEREAVQEGQSKGPAPLHCTGLLHLGHICLHDIAEDIPGDVGRRDFFS